jgi:hypothetical protein
VRGKGSLKAWQPVGVSARFVSLEMDEREREERVVYTVPPSALEHPTDDVIALDTSAVLEVAQHRGAPCAGRIG